MGNNQRGTRWVGGAFMANRESVCGVVSVSWLAESEVRVWECGILLGPVQWCLPRCIRLRTKVHRHGHAVFAQHPLFGSA